MKGVAVKAILVLACISMTIALFSSVGASGPMNDGTTTAGVDPGIVPVPQAVIRVDGEGDLAQLVIDGVATGSGTASDPYVIENYSINATDEGNAIFIGNTTSYLVIKNCSCLNAVLVGGLFANGAGISVYQATNIMMFNNCCDVNYYGIFLTSSQNITVCYNECNENEELGIFLNSSDDCTVSGNHCFLNEAGISLSSSHDNTISGNELITNGFNIDLDGSDRNIIIDNVLQNGTWGLYALGCSNSTVQDNICTNNFYGIELQSSDNNTVFRNVCTGINGYQGIILNAAKNNSIDSNTCSGLPSYGIRVYTGERNVISNNNCSNDSIGVQVEFSHFNIISNNNGSECTEYSIQLYSSSNNTISGNICKKGDLSDYGHAISLYYYSCQNQVLGNNCSGYERGISVYDHSSENLIGDNDLSENSYGIYLKRLLEDCAITNNDCSWNGYGIYLDDAHWTTVSNNTCTNNSHDGIYIYEAQNNQVSNNTCVDNWNFGIALYMAQYTQVVNNTCASPEMTYQNGTVGIHLSYSFNNNISLNRCNHNGEGIELGSSDLNIISDNDCSYNDNLIVNGVNQGIHLSGSSDNLVENNTCSGSSYGISISGGSDRNQLIGNDFSGNVQMGIYVYNGESDSNRMFNNTCNGNGYGMWLENTIYSEICGNTCDGNRKAGIYVKWRSHDNLIANNTLRDNGFQLVDEEGYGMEFAGHGLAVNGEGSDCYENTICNNTIEGSRLHGINLTFSNWNLLFGNVLIGNHGSTSEFDPSCLQAYDSGYNSWDTGSYGNLWGDWTSPDANGDGIIDVPYVIDGGSNQDNYPLAISVDITYPANGSVVTDPIAKISGTAVSYFGVSTITWHNQATDGSGVCLGTGSWNASLTLVEGENLIMVTMSDMAGNEAVSTLVLVLDSVPPQVEITSPAEGTFIGGSVTVTWNCLDEGSGISHYEVSTDGNNWTIVSENHFAFTGLSAGSKVLLVKAYDGAGNNATATVNVTVDASVPILETTSPADGYINTTGSVIITWIGNDTESGIDHYEISLDGGAPVTVPAATHSFTFNGMSDGSHLLKVTAVDKVGLASSDQVTVVVDTGAPSLVITSPSPWSYVNNGSVTVSWTADDAGVGIANFTISLDGGTAILLEAGITGHTFNGLPDGFHQVVVVATDLLGQSTPVTVDFTVDTGDPVVIILTPADSSYVNISTGIAAWTAVDATSSIDSTLVRVDGGEWTEVGAATDWMYSLGDGPHTLEVKVTDLADNSASALINFTVDVTSPHVIITSPMEGSYSLTNVTEIDWIAGDAVSGIALLQISLDGTHWTTVTGSSYVTAPLNEGPATFHVRVRDHAGNIATATVNFTVDSVTPTAVVSPTGDWVDVNALIIAQFSEEMDVSSVSLGIVGITGSVSWSGTMATFLHLAPLMYSRTYTVNLTGMDLAGNELNMSWSFTTIDITYIVGTVKDADGNNIQGVRVTIGNGTVSESQLTETDGRFSFSLVGNVSGTFTVALEKDGYLDLTMENMTIGQGDTEDLGSLVMDTEEQDRSGGSTALLAVILIAVTAVAAVVLIFLRKKR